MCDNTAAWTKERKARMAVEAPSLHYILPSPLIMSKAMKRCYWFLKERNLEN